MIQQWDSPILIDDEHDPAPCRTHHGRDLDTRAASVPRPSPSEDVLSVPGSTTGVAGGNAPPHISGVSSKAVTKGAMIGANTKAARLETGSAAVAASTSAPHHTAEAILALPSHPRPGVVPNPVTWARVVTAAGVSFTMPQSSTIVAPVDPILRQDRKSVV